MRPESAALLWDAREAADRLARFIGTRTLEEYLLAWDVAQTRLRALRFTLRTLLPDD